MVEGEGAGGVGGGGGVGGEAAGRPDTMTMKEQSMRRKLKACATRIMSVKKKKVTCGAFNIDTCTGAHVGMSFARIQRPFTKKELSSIDSSHQQTIKVISTSNMPSKAAVVGQCCCPRSGSNRGRPECSLHYTLTS